MDGFVDSSSAVSSEEEIRMGSARCCIVRS
jgi:hypothetical protein